MVWLPSTKVNTDRKCSQNSLREQNPNIKTETWLHERKTGGKRVKLVPVAFSIDQEFRRF